MRTKSGISYFSKLTLTNLYMITLFFPPFISPQLDINTCHETLDTVMILVWLNVIIKMLSGSLSYDIIVYEQYSTVNLDKIGAPKMRIILVL